MYGTRKAQGGSAALSPDGRPPCSLTPCLFLLYFHGDEVSEC